MKIRQYRRSTYGIRRGVHAISPSLHESVIFNRGSTAHYCRWNEECNCIWIEKKGKVSFSNRERLGAMNVFATAGSKSSSM